MTFLHKIKGMLADDTTFYGLIIGLVALSSFGLGRLSGQNSLNEPEIRGPINTATVVEASLLQREELAGSPDIATKTVPATSETLYVGSKNSDKYHLPWCSGAKRIAEANKVFFKSKEEAANAGYTPAANCKGI